MAEVDVHSDPGISDYCTLEVTWFEYDVEMRLYIYFTASDTHFWANEIRTYTGKDTDAEWIYYTGEFFKTELNSPFKGNVDLVSDEENPFKGRIHFENLTLSVRFRS